MKHIRLFEDFQKINEEWVPAGPFMNFKLHNGIATITELVGDHTLNFVGGDKDNKKVHGKEILEIIEALYNNENIEDLFKLHYFDEEGIDEMNIDSLVFYENNFENYDEFLDLISKYGEKKDNVFKLNNPIHVKINK